MGFTTGPYEVRLRGVGDTAAGRGHFVSVWRREGSGPWRVILDAGAAGPPLWPLTREGWREWESPADAPAAPSGTGAASQPDEVLQAHRAVGAGTEPGWRALPARLDASGRVYRQQRPVSVRRDDVRRVLKATTATYRAMPDAAAISCSNDLAMTLALYRLEVPNAATNYPGLYVRFRRRGPHGVRLVFRQSALPISARTPLIDRASTSYFAFRYRSHLVNY